MMRIRTLVLIPLFAVSAVQVHNSNVSVVSLTKSQSQISANAPQENKAILTKEDQLNSYLLERNRIVVSRSLARISLGKKIVNTGKNYFGVPYCRGGENPRCFDCSGFTQYVYNKQGIQIPRVAQDQYNQSHKIKKSEAIKGDLIFFMSNGYAYHVGIYMGNNKVLHSPKPGRRVKIETIWTNNVKFGRI